MPARNISHALTFAAIAPKAKIDLQLTKCVKHNNTKYEINVIIVIHSHCHSLQIL